MRRKLAPPSLVAVLGLLALYGVHGVAELGKIGSGVISGFRFTESLQYERYAYRIQATEANYESFLTGVKLRDCAFEVWKSPDERSIQVRRAEHAVFYPKLRRLLLLPTAPGAYPEVVDLVKREIKTPGKKREWF